MICFINRSTLDYDVRLQKYVQACKDTDTPYFIIGWDRMLNAKFTDENEYQMKVYCPYAQGKKLFPSICWFFFMWYHLIKHIRKYKVIHACNLENVIFAMPFKLLGKKIVFDIYDSLSIKLEHKIASNVDCLILPEEKRLKQIGVDKKELECFLEVENVPTFCDTINPVVGLKRDKVHLSYVGVFQKKIRGLENLLNMVLMDSRFILDIAGAGDGLEEMIEEAALKCNRVNYHGKVQYSEALNIMNNSDFIVALYYPYSSNHIYAAPNKYYESLFLSTPIITSRGTLVGDKVVQNNSGYAIGDTLQDLINFFESINSNNFKQEYQLKSNNCATIWKEIYENYKSNVMVGEYIRMIKTFLHK